MTRAAVAHGDAARAQGQARGCSLPARRGLGSAHRERSSIRRPVGEVAPQDDDVELRRRARESHDASPFYDRFRPPELSDDDTVLAPEPVAEPFVHGDARHMDALADGSVALVVTSPPYFAGKQYEEELERDGVPSSYLEYLEMLTDVFAECVRTLEPGGRIAVNVANLGRKPYRSLSADVIRILEHDLGLLLRGELIWQKGEGASGSCAWGSFRSAPTRCCATSPSGSSSPARAASTGPERWRSGPPRACPTRAR